MNKYFKVLVWDLAVEAALQRLFLLVPLLGWGPIGYVISRAARALSEYLFQELNKGIKNFEIQFVNEEHRKAFDKSTFVLMVLDNDPIATQEQRDEALKDAQRDMAKYVLYNVNRLP